MLLAWIGRGVSEFVGVKGLVRLAKKPRIPDVASRKVHFAKFAGRAVTGVGAKVGLNFISSTRRSPLCCFERKEFLC